ncbi:MAG: CDP-2,3-bis-(O-geranylgeranyl)-sn-glycerol synthase [Candidatus Kerfeldbacteria bacterium]
MTTLLEFLTLIAKMFWLFLPAGVANMAPVLFKDKFKSLAIPIDGGRTFRGRPLFGNHKTWRGMLVAVLFGGVIFILQYVLTYYFPSMRGWAPFDITTAPIWFGFVFGAGAIIGDLIKSFFKRRVSVKPGQSWFPFDQLDFAIGAALVAMLFFDLTWVMWVIIILVGPVFHILVNHIGYWLKLKDSPW